MSKTKPHRSASEKQYYYRHNTMSERMSELMISAMYRSQDYLATSALCTLTKYNNRLDIELIIDNDSMIAGTKPRFEVEILSSHQRVYGFSGEHINGSCGGSFQSNPNYNLYINTKFATNNVFAECILYPKDKIVVIGMGHPSPAHSSLTDTLESVKLFIIRFSYNFLEIPRQVKYFLIDTNPSDSEEQQSCKVLMTCSGNDNSAIDQMYREASLLNLQ